MRTGNVKASAVTLDAGRAYGGEDAARENTQVENLLETQGEFIGAISSKLMAILGRAGAPVPGLEKARPVGGWVTRVEAHNEVPGLEKARPVGGWVTRVEAHNEELMAIDGMLQQLGLIV